ncbi:MAG: PEP-CTERM system histidine kinase PrsK [Nitrospirae bacterium CG18_big_fil_WC_8_21_14_2_50_70_55]|nr:PEP-CTERM system histidine kinase PrsK [Deltaproteobacteria bacterium]OIP66356.1 MAG: hypothetical protein AUK30_02640 [Nitrospirae bacterium CG2_30_70_394]PIQ07216.1 MAG: PEP-CTERM system histidine kinase PrsK [Nitrospirae bacterium CG18_big_fil_WC_8_21_14_2_50_70_55]PIU78489.1 MAG: PEP-CTERM system histidine kinase PrsK [Nitrospirae bacterium CG06_land_8_20_14_3_00_70_43]PIW83208.1 MAG: PEP-CTERM system histidine kinase PrsK [Nitrospirae bacterium CG_4_8_14_3_um_filter_70_85]PIX84408.1 MA
MWYRSIPPLAAALAALLIGLVVLVRRGRPVTNRAFVLAMVGVALQCGAMGILWGGEYLVHAPLFARLALAGLGLQAAGWYWVSASFGRGTPYRLSARQRWAGWAMAALAPVGALTCFPWIFAPELVYEPPVALFHLGVGGRPFFALLFLAFVWALLNLENLYRAAPGEVRWRAKGFALGMGGWLVYLLFHLSQTLLFASERVDLAARDGAVATVCVGLLCFAILRHRLLEVEVFVSRYVVYHSLTFLLVGGYLLAVGVVAEGVRWLNRPLDLLARDLFVFLALLFLGALLLSEGLRRRLRRTIEQNFYRHRYDYQKEWLTFTDRLGRRVAAEEIIPEILHMVCETLWVNEASLWVRAEGGGLYRLARLRGNTPPVPTLEADTPLLRYLGDRRKAATRSAWEAEGAVAAAVTALAPMRVEMAVPLVAAGECVGLITVGPEISGSRFDDEDAAILDALAGQGAAALRAAMLAERLAAAREAETFQRLSSFLVHDLKNFSHMLGLIVQNAERNMDNPEFQRDAMRTIGDIVAKMRTMTTNLRDFTHPPALRRREVELVELARRVVAQLPVVVGVEVEGVVADGPVRVDADAEELEKVLYNLCRNGQEAIAGAGRLRVEVGRDPHSVWVRVADTGEGMSPQFLDQELFRPFHTTKKAGLGIGCFQSRTIVEAHGGTLAVASTPGEGTVFTVRLPG